MNIEHFAINVSQPVAMARWYAANLGMQIVRSLGIAVACLLGLLGLLMAIYLVLGSSP